MPRGWGKRVPVKFRCERDVLVEALAMAGRASTTRNALPVLSGVKLTLTGDRLSVTGSDLELTITVTIDVAGAADGIAVLPAKLAADIVRHFEPGAIEIDATGERPRVSGGRSEFFLNSIPADEYPARHEAVGESVTLAAGDLAEGLRQVVKAASTDDSRPVLTGVHFHFKPGELRLAAADGFRLSVHTMPLAAEVERAVIVPARALGELGRLLQEAGTGDVAVTFNSAGTQVQFDVGHARLIANLIQGTFPNYEQLIPSNYTTRTEVSVGDFVRETRIASIFARDGSGIVRVIASPGEGSDPGSLHITARAEEVGDNEGVLDAVVEGTESKIAFNGRYLTDVLNVIDTDRVALETTSPSSPGVLRPVGDDRFIHVVMPMFVQW